ncbi:MULTISPECIES: hypothetical protein [Saccharothrix]|uniref:hypothetical protein n=1 Tax=Saccharothrix TaxID=2071 RepID=UPI0009662526|nr:hypothetical protein [Saccharothrix sp. CB00851]OKI35483.1 hypothetical protein A6A25_23750 [Saccharothrix sp. CB00851]
MDVRRLVVPVAAGVVAAVAFGVWSFTTRHSATPDVVEGWAMPNTTGTAISLHDSNDTREGNGYEIAGAWWADGDNAWHAGGGPTCVGTDTAVKTRVRLGIVDVQAGGEGVDGPRVVWLRCLD